MKLLNLFSTCLFLLVVLTILFNYSIDSFAARMESSKPEASALSGRLWDQTGTPIAHGYVFALNKSSQEVLGYSQTAGGLGPDSGSWQITNLPAEGVILLVGFYPDYKFVMAIKEVDLKAQHQNVPLTAKTLRHDNMPSGKAGAYGLLGWIANEINVVKSNQKALSLAEHLLNVLDKREKTPSQIALSELCNHMADYEGQTLVVEGVLDYTYPCQECEQPVLRKNDQTLEVTYPCYVEPGSESFVEKHVKGSIMKLPHFYHGFNDTLCQYNPPFIMMPFAGPAS